MVMLVLRCGLIIIAIFFLLTNVVYPLFKQDLPLFWMFKSQKYRKKYREQFKTLQDIEDEQVVLKELKEKQEQIKKRSE